MGVSVADIRWALKILKAVPLEDIALALNDPKNLDNDLAVAEDIAGIVAMFVPQVGLALTAFNILYALFQSGVLRPDPLPMTDAQTSEGRGGQRP